MNYIIDLQCTNAMLLIDNSLVWFRCFITDLTVGLYWCHNNFFAALLLPQQNISSLKKHLGLCHFLRMQDNECHNNYGSQRGLWFYVCSKVRSSYFPFCS